jgi:hypothetical protein
MIKARIKLIHPTSHKLYFVKLIKDCTGMGLKESKDLCDALHTPNVSWQSIQFSGPEMIQKFRLGLRDLPSGQFSITGGQDFDRDVKLLKLGFGEIDELRKLIIEHLLLNPEDCEKVLTKLIGKLPKNKLIEIIQGMEV